MHLSYCCHQKQGYFSVPMLKLKRYIFYVKSFSRNFFVMKLIWRKKWNYVYIFMLYEQNFCPVNSKKKITKKYFFDVIKKSVSYNLDLDGCLWKGQKCQKGKRNQRSDSKKWPGNLRQVSLLWFSDRLYSI